MTLLRAVTADVNPCFSPADANGEFHVSKGS
jgi:hypothetical protein